MNPPSFDYHWTLARDCHWQGIGLHSGQFAQLGLWPHSEPGFFLLHEGQLFPLTVDAVSQTQYCTRLHWGAAAIQTVEHVLAALVGLGFSAAKLTLTGPEIPILDGSATDFVQVLQAAGIQALPQRRRFFRPEPGQWQRAGAFLRWEPSDTLEIDYQIDYPGPPALHQSCHFVWSPHAFVTEIAAARTFVYLREVAPLRALGLAQGGSRDNALVIDQQVPGPEWRWPDEPARHKVLDLLGDLALLGAFPLARIQACRTGHEAHVTMVKSWLGKSAHDR